MLIIGFGVTEVLLSTLVFTCETCGNHGAQAEPQVLTFFHSAVLGRYEISRQLYCLWADHRGQPGAGGGSGPAGRPGPAVTTLLRRYAGLAKRCRAPEETRHRRFMRATNDQACGPCSSRRSVVTATYAVGILLLAALGTRAIRRPDTALGGTK